MSAADDLRSFVEGQPLRTTLLDPDRALEHWRATVDALFSDVTVWMSWITETTGAIERVKLDKNEDFFGSYQIDGLSVTLSGREFFFEPRGRVVIGADGRVDVYEVGRIDHLVLLLYFEKKNEVGAWEIRSPTDRLSGIALTSETLQEVLLRWMKD